MTYKLAIKMLCCALLLALSAGLVSADADEVTIVISPNVVNLDSVGTWVTVHAEISYYDVDRLTVSLDGIDVVYIKSDARGELVAKFNLDDVKDILSEGEVDLTLSGNTFEGVEFIGTDTIKVIVPAGKR
jgi:hypothetical protein